MLQKIYLFIVFLTSSTTLYSQVIQGEIRPLFEEYPQVAVQLFVYDRSLFTEYKGASVNRLNVPDYEERRRIGVVNFSSNVTVYVDRIDNRVHGPASLEITDAKSGFSLAKFDLGLIAPSNRDAKLLFNGQGIVYLHHVPTTVCYGQTTRKFTLNGKKLVETKQAIAFVGTDAKVIGDIRLFSSPDGAGSTVATLQDGANVSVVGIHPDSVVTVPKSDESRPTLLVKTPLGLSGWYVPGRSGLEHNGVSITTCN